MTFLEEINIQDFVQEEDHNDDRAYLLPAIAILSLILQQNRPLILRMMPYPLWLRNRRQIPFHLPEVHGQMQLLESQLRRGLYKSRLQSDLTFHQVKLWHLQHPQQLSNCQTIIEVNSIALYFFQSLIVKSIGFHEPHSRAEQWRGDVEGNENRPMDLGKDFRTFTH